MVMSVTPNSVTPHMVTPVTTNTVTPHSYATCGYASYATVTPNSVTHVRLRRLCQTWLRHIVTLHVITSVTPRLRHIRLRHMVTSVTPNTFTPHSYATYETPSLLA